MHLPLEILISITRADYFLMYLLRLITFLHGSLTAINAVLLLWTYSNFWLKHMLCSSRQSFTEFRIFIEFSLTSKVEAPFAPTQSLKAHWQTFKKRCYEKYCSCDQACQVSTSEGTPWRIYLENPTIDDNGRRVRLFTHQKMCREEKIISASQQGCEIVVK